MKALALRPRDIADIEGIVSVVPDLDLDRVRRTVAEFSEALESDDSSPSSTGSCKRRSEAAVERRYWCQSARS